MKSLFIALGFLTRIPSPYSNATYTEKEMASSLACFPLVGLIAGCLVAAIDALATKFLGTMVASGVDLAAFFLITGGLHLDGLMDTADGLLSGKERERALEIMKDSRVGALGASIASLVLILKFALLASFPEGTRLAVLALFPAIGRWAMVPAITFFPYARKKGLGKSFWSFSTKKEFFVATALISALAIILLGERGLCSLAVAGGGTFLVAKRISQTLGGLTGDTYGAINEIAEILALMIMATRLQ
ncbi:adenosylcobinamide-GDP ribazoletransferase [Thermovirga lienii]|uniref:adenosylcobinamide-GDP ribazoletransferase n=1 Tax=Thermovirga lienii TaxID=336261 RepID=UPI000EC42304|nr:adenosylcobinamide-GDP ribazoletransferase [Thermovirga lienii]